MSIFYLLVDGLEVNKNDDDNRIFMAVFLPALLFQINFCLVEIGVIFQAFYVYVYTDIDTNWLLNAMVPFPRAIFISLWELTLYRGTWGLEKKDCYIKNNIIFKKHIIVKIYFL